MRRLLSLSVSPSPYFCVYFENADQETGPPNTEHHKPLSRRRSKNIENTTWHLRQSQDCFLHMVLVSGRLLVAELLSNVLHSISFSYQACIGFVARWKVIQNDSPYFRILLTIWK